MKLKTKRLKEKNENLLKQVEKNVAALQNPTPISEKNFIEYKLVIDENGKARFEVNADKFIEAIRGKKE